MGLATSFYNDRDADLAENLTKTLLETHQTIPDFLEQYIPEGFTADGQGDINNLKFEADSDYGDDDDNGGALIEGGNDAWGASDTPAAVTSADAWGSAPASAPAQAQSGNGWVATEPPAPAVLTHMVPGAPVVPLTPMTAGASVGPVATTGAPVVSSIPLAPAVPMVHGTPIVHATPMVHSSPMAHSTPVVHTTPMAPPAPVVHATPMAPGAPVVHATPIAPAAPVVPVGISQQWTSMPPTHSATAPQGTPANQWITQGATVASPTADPVAKSADAWEASGGWGASTSGGW
jgi:ATP-dependent RNA helicase DDX3X